jgi:hypothetical protein
MKQNVVFGNRSLVFTSENRVVSDVKMRFAKRLLKSRVNIGNDNKKQRNLGLL